MNLLNFSSPRSEHFLEPPLEWTVEFKLIDLRAAYDLVSRDILIQKMIEMNLSGSMIHCVCDFLCQRFISVRCNDYTTPYKQVKRGLPQGAVSSTTLFNIFLNDLCYKLRSIPGIEIILYADDLAIMVLGDSMKIMENIMNCALNVLHEWTNENQMEVNTEKTKYQIFSMCDIIFKPNLFFGNVTVEETLNQCYLGITLDQRLTFKNHVNDLVSKAQNRLKLLKRLTGTMWGTSKDTLLLTYKMYIHPVLTYGEELLITASDSVNNKLDIIQNKALRTICGGVKFTPITAMEMFTDMKTDMKIIRKNYQNTEQLMEQFHNH